VVSMWMSQNDDCALLTTGNGTSLEPSAASVTGRSRRLDRDHGTSCHKTSDDLNERLTASNGHLKHFCLDSDVAANCLIVPQKESYILTQLHPEFAAFTVECRHSGFPIRLSCLLVHPYYGAGTSATEELLKFMNYFTLLLVPYGVGISTPVGIRRR
jgi:hypothetical protein